jgi:hypothetical protein
MMQVIFLTRIMKDSAFTLPLTHFKLTSQRPAYSLFHTNTSKHPT